MAGEQKGILAMNMHFTDSSEWQRKQKEEKEEAEQKRRERQSRTVYFINHPDEQRDEPRLPEYDALFEAVTRRMGSVILNCVQSEFQGYGGLMPDIDNEWSIREQRVMQQHDWGHWEYCRNRDPMFDRLATRIQTAPKLGRQALMIAEGRPSEELVHVLPLGVRFQLREYQLVETDDQSPERGQMIFQTDQSVHRDTDGLYQKHVKSLTITSHDPETGLPQNILHESEKFDLALSPDEKQGLNPDQLGIPALFINGERSVETHHWGGGYLKGVDKRTAYY